MSNRLPKHRITAGVVALAVGLGGCLGAMTTGAAGYTLVDGKAMTKVQEIGDPELAADAKRLEGKSLQAGTGPYYAALCMQNYIDARHAERTAANTQQESMQAMSAYAVCAGMCKNAYQEIKSEFSDLAAKYHPRCEERLAGHKAQITIDALARQVQTFEDAREPLALYFAERDSQTLLAQATSEAPNNPRLAQLADAITKLAAERASAIRRGKAFFESPEAQENFAKREAVNAEREAIEEDIKSIERVQDELGRDGSLDSYMEKRRLDDQLRAKHRVLDAKRAELSRLQEEYKRMARTKGVING